MNQSKTDAAYKHIKDKILSGKLPPSTSISEDTFQAELGVSRTPIREALRLLEKEGFVKFYPRKSILVTPISLDILNEIYDVRLAIEPIFARRACGKISEQTLLTFREKFSKQPSTFKKESDLALYYNTLDASFHQSLIQYAENRFFTESITLVLDHEKRIRNITFSPENNARAVEEHLAMIDAFLAQDVERLVQLSITHVEHAKKKAFSHILHL